MSGPTTWITLILVGMMVLFSVVAGGSFASWGNIRNMFASVAILIILALGEMLIILTAGIDLSCGGVLVFSGVLAASTMNALGGTTTGILVGLLVSVVAGLCWGLLNGILVTKAKVPPLIATLGTMGMSMGLALVIINGIDLRVPVSLVETLGVSDLFGVVPWIAVIALALAVVVAVLLSQTVFGRHTYAVGASPAAAERSGIRVQRHLITVYALAGLLVGVAGFLALSRFGTTTVSGHTQDNIKAITAVVLGGTSLFGGLGTVRGVVIGAFIPVILLNGFVIIGVEAFWQLFAIGLVLVIAVYIDQRRHSSEETS